MELSDSIYDNHITKCRCCLTSLEGNKKIKINRKIEKLFLDVTQIQLRSSKKYSIYFCELCFNDLEGFASFKNDTVKKQNRLYEIVDGRKSVRLRNKKEKQISYNEDEQPAADYVSDEVLIKVEPKDEIEDPIIQFVKEEEINEPYHEENLIIEPPEHLYEESVTNQSDDNQDDDDDDGQEDLFEETFKDIPLPKKKSKIKKKQKKYPCTRCDPPRQFLAPHTLQVHIDTEHLKLKLKCKFCSYETYSSNSLHGHTSRLHNGELDRKQQCPTCGVFVVDLKNHTYSVHVKPRNVVCDKCGYGIHSLHRLRRHMFKHLSFETKFEKIGVVCPVCNMKLLGRGKTLSLHMKNVHSEGENEPVTCHCGKVYKALAGLKIHQKTAHQPDDKKSQFECRICHKTFMHKQSLKDHYEIHQRNGRKDFACQFCGKMYGSIVLLNKHLIFHTEAKHKCTQCDKKYVLNCFLQRHIKREHNAVFANCEHCGKSLNTLQMERHIKEFHSGLSKQQCVVPGCSSKFLRKWHLKDHMQRIHKDYEDSLSEAEKKFFNAEMKRIQEFMF